MIQYLHSSNIDRKKWDESIARSACRHHYALAWHLDLVCPGWSGLVMNDYEAVMPLPVRKKYGIRYVFQPYFSQQLGIYNEKKTGPDLLQEFIEAVPSDIRYMEFNLNHFNEVNDLYHFKERSNFELNLSPDYAFLENNYSANTRRNLRKSEKPGINEISDISCIIELKKKFDAIRKPPAHYNFLENWMKGILDRGMGRILKIGTEQLLAAVFLVQYGNRIYYMVPVSSPEGKKNSAMFFLVDHLIRSHAGNDMILDFEGSTIPGIARFFKGFGAINQPYHSIKMNRLPFPLKLIKK